MVQESYNMIIYTDGSCLNNPGAGGWSVFISDKSTIIYGHDPNTTNNRMELYAILVALNHIGTEDVIIYTDSVYCQKGLTQWMYSWKRNNWKDIKNPDLWKAIFFKNRNNIKYEWIPRCNNKIADKYAKYAAKNSHIGKIQYIYE